MGPSPLKLKNLKSGVGHLGLAKTRTGAGGGSNESHIKKSYSKINQFGICY